jgi:hypothetical protein
MKRLQRLMVLLSLVAYWPAPGRAAEPSSLLVQFRIFSGRPDPTFVISDLAVIRQLSSILAVLPPHPTLAGNDSATPLRSGYRGFHVTPTGMDGVAWFDVYGSSVEISATTTGGARTFRFDKNTVLEQLLLQAGRAQGVVPADEPSPLSPVAPTGSSVERNVTISVGAPIVTVVATPLRPPVTVRAGTRVRFVATQAAEGASDVTWVRNSREIAGPRGRTLEIASATPADSGLYWAVVGLDGGLRTTTAQVEVLVTNREGQRLLNLSVLSRIGAEQRVLTSGFTIEPGAENSRALVLVRAVGPALASLGVDGPLRAPQLRVLDAAGAAVSPANIPFALPTVAAATERVGAFALPGESADVALLYHLPTGAFTAHVSAADGGTGNVLLEIYEVPLD